MKPSRVSSELCRIAAGIDNCSTAPRRDFVVRDLRRVIAAVENPDIMQGFFEAVGGDDPTAVPSWLAEVKGRFPTGPVWVAPYSFGWYASGQQFSLEAISEAGWETDGLTEVKQYRSSQEFIDDDATIWWMMGGAEEPGDMDAISDATYALVVFKEGGLDTAKLMAFMEKLIEPLEPEQKEFVLGHVERSEYMDWPEFWKVMKQG